MQLAPQGDFTARLKLTANPLDRALSLLGERAVQASGDVNANLDLRGSMARLGQIETCVANGRKQ
jgi:hypothetical protein